MNKLHAIHLVPDNSLEQNTSKISKKESRIVFICELFKITLVKIRMPLYLPTKTINYQHRIDIRIRMNNQTNYLIAFNPKSQNQQKSHH